MKSFRQPFVGGLRLAVHSTLKAKRTTTSTGSIFCTFSQISKGKLRCTCHEMMEVVVVDGKQGITETIQNEIQDTGHAVFFIAGG